MNRYQWQTRLRGCLAQITPTEFIVLTMLSSYSDRDGTDAAPAADTLAAACGVSSKTVRRCLAALVDKGYLVVSRQGGGKRRPTVYDLVWDMPHLPANVDTQDVQVSDPVNIDTQGVQVSDDANVDNLDTQGVQVSPDTAADTWTNRPPYVDTQGVHQPGDQEIHRGLRKETNLRGEAAAPTPTADPQCEECDKPMHGGHRHTRTPAVHPHHQTRGALALVHSADPDDDPEPADKCARHRTRIGRVDEPCGPCRDARLAHQAWTTRTTERAAAERTAAVNARRQAITNCHRCDEFGWQLAPDGTTIDPARRCTHPQE